MTEASTAYGQANGYAESIDPASRAFAGEPDQALLRRTAGDGITDALTRLSDEIEARPDVAAGIALFAGLLLGIALGRPARAVVYLRD